MVHCLWPLFRPFFGNNLASNPSAKIPTRMAISVISTVVFVISVPRSFRRAREFPIPVSPPAHLPSAGRRQFPFRIQRRKPLLASESAHRPLCAREQISARPVAHTQSLQCRPRESPTKRGPLRQRLQFH